MQHFLAHRKISTSARIDFLSIGVLLVFLWGWHWRVNGYLSPAAGASLAFFLVICLAYGSIFMRLVAPLFTTSQYLPFQVLSGYLVFNSLLFVTALSSPAGMVANLAILSAVAAACLVLMRKCPAPTVEVTVSDRLAGCLVLAISCIGATICCSDVQVPLYENGNVIYRVWDDVYIHAREISVFAQAHGIGSIHDIKMAGGRAPIYHFGSYLSPAAISVLSGATAMNVYASFQLPLGILLTGIAAFCLFGKFFGSGPGIAAAVAVVLIPDAFQQGFGIRYLSYNFMAQVNLGMLYGIACAALAWMFMIDGCRRNKFGLIILSYGFLLLCLFYKVHIFVANSYALMMFPVVFFTKIRPSWRAGIGILATLIFCVAISVAQNNPRVPIMRLDGSGIGHYIVTLFRAADPGWIRTTFSRLLVTEKHNIALQSIYGATFLLLSTLGYWVICMLLVLVKTKRTIAPIVWWFPVIATGNYLIMTMGLALDTRYIGSPDELLNRPLVWVYFVVAAWTAAAGYRVLIGAALPNRKQTPYAFLTLLLATGAAVYSAPNLQTYAQYGAPTFKSGAVPVCLVNAATYVRLHSAPHDVVLEAAADRRFKFTALSERQLYVGEEVFGGWSVQQEQRKTDAAALLKSTDAAEILEFFAARHIDWFVQRPDKLLAWPNAGLPQPEYSCGGFKVFRFSHKS